MAEPVIIDGGGGGGSRTLETIIILAVLVVGAWFLFTRVKAKPAPIVVDKVPPEPDKAPPLAGTGKINLPDSFKRAAEIASRGIQIPGRDYQCPPGMVPGIGGCITGGVGMTSAAIVTPPPPAAPPPVKAALLVIDKPPPVSAPAGAVAVPGPVPPQQPKPVSSTLLGTQGRPGLVTIPQPIAPKPSPPPPPPPATVPLKVTTLVKSNTLTPALAAVVKPLSSTPSKVTNLVRR